MVVTQVTVYRAHVRIVGSSYFQVSTPSSFLSYVICSRPSTETFTFQGKVLHFFLNYSRAGEKQSMEEITSEETMTQKKETQLISKPKGGFKTMPFIIGNEAFEKVATYGTQPNMILYLMSGYNMDTATGTSILLLWSATSNFMPIIGAFLSDAYLGRFSVISLGSISSLVGMILLWSTTIFPGSKPIPCNQSFEICKPATLPQLALLFSSLGFMSIGCGGIRPCSLAFGADQLDRKEDPRHQRILNSYFNWYYISVGISTMLAVTVVVYVQDHLGWKVGFGVPALLMFFSALFFSLGSSLYVKVEANKSLFTGFAQVLVVAFKNRNLDFPSSNSDDGWYLHCKGSKLVTPTKTLRCLNKACIIRDSERDLNLDGAASDPWSLCTVDQVEDLKSLVKIIPFWSSGIMVSISISQNTFALIQANTMNRHITSNFEIPAGSFSVFTLITLATWIAIYDRIVVPRLSKLTGRPQGITHLQRMGVGLVIIFISMVVSALVEGVRRRAAIEQGFMEDPLATVDMSALWLVPQPCLVGLAEAFFAVGQVEFYYSQLPKTMASIGMALSSLGMAIGNLLASFLVKAVDGITGGDEGKESWVSSNPNKGHYDYYYWLLAVLCLINSCCWAFEPSEEERSTTVSTDDEECYSLLLGGSHSNEE